MISGKRGYCSGASFKRAGWVVDIYYNERLTNSEHEVGHLSVLCARPFVQSDSQVRVIFLCQVRGPRALSRPFFFL